MDLALAEAEFWELTLRELTRLGAQHQEAEKRADRRAGWLTSMFYNANKEKGGKTMTPADFFPSLREATRPEREQTDEELAVEMAKLERWFERFFPTPERAG